MDLPKTPLVRHQEPQTLELVEVILGRYGTKVEDDCGSGRASEGLAQPQQQSKELKGWHAVLHRGRVDKLALQRCKDYAEDMSVV